MSPEMSGFVRSEVARINGPEPAGTFYVIVCRLCGDPDRPLPMPFNSPAERGKWAAGHTAGTGHDRWFVLDQPAGSSGPAEIPAVIREHDQVVAAWRSGYETGERQ
jgi:hypothetical protein